MPVSTPITIRSFSQEEFGNVAYEIVGHAFAMHAALGRKFHESIYEGTMQEIVGSRAISELAITVSHRSFVKVFYIDILIDSGCPFELKAASKITNDHISQLIQYMMLLDLRHGKIINFGAEKLEHRFVNCHESGEQRRKFEIDRHYWIDSLETVEFENTLVEIVRDWGTGLSRSLYEEACVHCFGGDDHCRQFAETMWNGKRTGRQPVKVLNGKTAFEITCRRGDIAAYGAHLRKMVLNTNLDTILWANIVSGKVRFERICR